MTLKLFFVIVFSYLLYLLLFYFIELFNARKCHYDCSKCKNWHCQYHECERKRKKLKGN